MTEHAPTVAKSSANPAPLRAFFQPKLTVNPPGDAYEQEADQVADTVVRMPLGTTPFFSGKPAVIQRKCAHCEEEEKAVQRKGGERMETAPRAVETVLAQSGQPLDGEARQFMESRIGQDFSSVRVHTDGAAAHSAASIGARAYTSGTDVVFGAGEFSPNTESGRHLLAHELTHVVQQGGSTQTVQRDSVYEETPGASTTFSTGPAGAQYAGYVDRTEYRSEADRQAHRNPIHSSRVNVRFNESTCQLIVPLTIRIVNQTAANPTSCGNISGVQNDPITPVSQAVFDRTKRQFLTDLPAALNGWYSVMLDGTGCGACREVPVRVEFTEVTSGTADRTVIVTGNSGRSYVSGDGSTVGVCGGSGGESTSTLIHEGGHFALGIGDEYHEDQGTRPTERERLGQHSRMAQDAPSRLLEFHERHFAFAEAFMRSMYPTCQPRLRRTRSAAVEFNFFLNEGFLSPDGGSGDPAFSLGVQFGIPLLPMRRLSLMLGPNFTYLATSQDFMAGFRAGLQGRVTLGRLGPLGTAGLGFRAFGEGGARFDFSRPSVTTTPYLEGGGGLDLRLSDQFRIGVEAARGVMDVGGASPLPYSRYSAQFGLSF